LGAGVWRWQFEAEGQSRADVEASQLIPVEVGGSEFFRTFEMPLLRGRGFSEVDREDAPKVVVVSQSIVNRYWPDKDPIGRRIRVTGDPSFLPSGSAWRTVVGVVGDPHFRSFREATPTVYLPWRQGYWQGIFALRTTGELQSVLPALRRELAAVDPQIKMWEAQSMDELLSGPLSTPRLSAFLMSVFGFTALLLAAIGLYGIMAAAVREQTHDIGVRMALGASPSHVRRQVLSNALGVATAGAVVGIAVALLASRLLTSLLFAVSPTDPIALLGACALLLSVSLVAALLPARHATRISPARALRAE
jgi:predicted permease